ncbi:hypothetical protein K435DRAFT_772305 [Dendrothele bispora CBS 962.96]|uniref:Uncharacterized protein n=1 Tax=Dendrothele bispora (strain CBS 962.96) TaxID=1314807 RepID=A0A4S8MX58_DENBC|nr:hypothetical protein K435DRAFT_772305 [Dendrothele bispora CBS 962.96]
MPVQVSAVEEPEVDFNSTLNLQLSFTAETATAVKALLKSAAALSRLSPHHRNRYLHSSEPPESEKCLKFVPGKWMSMSIAGFPTDDGPALGFTPIFSRERRIGGANSDARKEMKKAANPVLFAGSKSRSRRSSPKAVEKTVAPPIPNSMADLVAPVEVEQFFASNPTLQEVSNSHFPEDTRKINVGLSKVGLEETGLGIGEGELYKENMVVINGWETYVTSSPARSSSSSLNPNSSQEEDQLLDELLNEWRSSPDTELSSFDLLKDSRMDLPAIPRSRRIGGAGSAECEQRKSRPLAANKSYAAFLLESLSSHDMVPVPEDEPESPENTCESPGSRPKPSTSDQNAKEANVKNSCTFRSSSPSLSMIGQPPSVLEVPEALTSLDKELLGMSKPISNSLVKDFGAEIRSIYLPTLREEGLVKEDGGIDPMKIILKEKLDERGVGIAGKGPGSLFMEVPDLPPPTEHPPNEFFLPKKLSDYLVPNNGKSITTDVPLSQQYLKKVKGIQPIALQLSWVPFTVSGRLPTHLEVIDVSSLFPEVETVGYNKIKTDMEMRLGMSIGSTRKRVAELLKKTQDQNAELAEVVEKRRWECWDRSMWEDGEDDVFCEDIFRSELVLSREERKRLLGLANLGETAVVSAAEQSSAVGDSEDGEDPRSGKAGDLKLLEADGDGGDSDKENWDPRDLDLPQRPRERPDEILEPGRPPKRPRLDTPTHRKTGDIAADSNDDMLLEDDFFDDSGVCFFSGTNFPLWNSQEQDSILFKQERTDEDYRRNSSGRAARQHDLAVNNQQGTHPDLDFRSSSKDLATCSSSHHIEGPEQEANYDHSLPSENSNTYTEVPSDLRSPSHVQKLGNHADHDHSSQFEPLCPGTQIPDTRHDDVIALKIPLSGTEHYNADLSSLHQEIASSSITNDRTHSNASGSKQPGIPLNIEFLNHAAGIAEFASLRGKKLNLTHEPLSTSSTNVIAPGTIDSHSIHPSASAMTDSTLSNTSGSVRRETPAELVNSDTLQLPSLRSLPTSPHWYMASMDLLQKQALVRSLRSQDCGITLIERLSLDGVDVIIDSYTAIIFMNLPSLPVKCEDLVNLVSQQSWRYSRILVVFEAYPASLSLRSSNKIQGDAIDLNVYSPPVMKAVKKLRRDISVAEVCEEKDARCQVFLAFANTVEEAGFLTRLFGDMAEMEDVQTTGGLLWGDRGWLEGDTPDEEESMAAADGMNRFAAYMILCQIAVDDFIEMAPGERVTKFGPFVGDQRMILLNHIIEERSRALEESEIGAG